MWPGVSDKPNRAVAEQVVVAVDEDELALLAGVVAGQEEVAGDGAGIPARLPLAPLHDHRDVRGQQREATGVVVVQVGEDDPGDRRDVDLVQQRQLLLEGDQAHRRRPVVEPGRVGAGVGVQAGIDEDPLALGLDHVGGDREAQALLGILALAPDRG